MSTLHYSWRYQAAVYEGIEYIIDSKPKSFIFTKYFARMLLEFLILAPMVPPKLIYDVQQWDR